MIFYFQENKIAKFEDSFFNSEAPIENVAAYDVASFTLEELANYVINLSDNDIYSLCSEDLIIHSNSDITTKVLGVLYNIAESFNSNTTKALVRRLPCPNDNFPTNLLRKYRSISENLQESERCELLIKDIVLPVNTRWKC